MNKANFENIKILSFILCIKTRRENSFIYFWENRKKLASSIGLSYNTYKKYLNKCIELGFVLYSGRNIQFIGLKKIIEELFPEGNLDRTEFFGNEKQENFRAYRNKIEKALLFKNLNQQAWNISRKEKLVPKNGVKKCYSKIKALLKEHNCSIENLTHVLGLNSNLITGKFHTAKQLGCSPQTGANRLRKWEKEKFFKREKVYTFFPVEVNLYSFDVLKELGYKYIFPAKNQKGFVCSLGSIISFI